MDRLRQFFKFGDLDPEKKLFVFALFAMATAGLAMGINHLLKRATVSNTNHTAMLGVIYPDGTDIKRKAFRTFEFSKINTTENLFQKDTIYVGPGSKAVLDLKQYGTLKLSPNAVVLITLDFEDEKTASNEVVAVKTAKRKTLRMKLEEGQAEFIKAPEPKLTTIAKSNSDKLVGVAPNDTTDDKIVLEIGSKVEVDLSNQETFKAENTKENVAHVIAATNPGDVRATTKTKTGDRERVKLSLTEAIKVTPQGIEKVEAPASLETQAPLVTEKSVQTATKEPVVQPPPAAKIRKVTSLQAPTNRKPAQVETPEQNATEARTDPPAEVPVEALPKVTKEVSHEQNRSNRYTTFELAPRTFFTRLDGRDLTTQDTALIFSNLSFGLAGSWDFHWSESFKSYVTIDLQRLKMRPANNGQTITGQNQTIGSLGAGVKFNLGARFELGAGVALAQELFFDSTSATTVDLKALQVPEILANAKFALIPSEPLGLYFELGAASLLPVTSGATVSKSGSRIETKMTLEQVLASLRLTSSVMYDRASYNTNQATQTRQNLGLSLGVSFDLGRRKDLAGEQP